LLLLVVLVLPIGSRASTQGELVGVSSPPGSSRGTLDALARSDS